MDYTSPSTIENSGRIAYISGIKRNDCPISKRTGMNDIHHWNRGWDLEASKTCKGKGCSAKRGVGHSVQCEKEHEKTLAMSRLTNPHG